ncbi:MAG TPA: hypothetical protein VKS01_04140 [Bryobacteraceae bacterium]|nr:hypothetical protein [Bryobacteraceae bacterium]
MKTALIVAVALGGAANAATTITNPETFVREVYQKIKAAETSGSYQPPEDIYAPQLKPLIEEDRRRAHGEAGCIDFDFWINGQDSDLKSIRVTSQPGKASAEQMTVIATFINEKPQEIHFEFRRVNGKWLLAEARSLKAERWTLSKIVKCW